MHTDVIPVLKLFTFYFPCNIICSKMHLTFETQRPRKPKTQRPKGPETERLRNPNTQRPKGPETQRPRDLGTQRPRNPET